MSAETDMVTALTADTTLAALIGERLGPWPLPQGETLPALTYYRVDSPTTQAINGSVFERRPRFTLAVWTESPADRTEVSEALVAALLAMGGYVTLADEGRDVPEPVTGLFRRDIDIRWLR